MCGAARARRGMRFMLEPQALRSIFMKPRADVYDGFISSPRDLSRFFMASHSILRVAVADRGMRVMFHSNDQDQVQRLLKRVEGASAPDTRLFADVIANACPRTLVLFEMRKAARLKQLIDAEAWTDVALALLGLELPQWKVRRIVCDDGEWHCRLSAQPWLPEGFDEVVEAFHRTLALAIVAAVVQARQQTAPASQIDKPADIVLSPEPIRICCDNFC
jgi:hypothetical protein